MPYREAKVYFDGGHYIAIPSENFPSEKRKGRKKSKPTPQQQTIETPTPPTPKEKFTEAYQESKDLRKRERKKYITEKLKDDFKSKVELNEFVASNLEREKVNSIKRQIRLWRKVYTQGEWHYFVTFTYDDKKHTEESFKKKLRNTLKHMVSRNGWKYIGVWERGGDTGRLHFHGIFYIPKMIGKIEEVKDYSTKQHKIQITHPNTHFLEEFGRNDFVKIEHPTDIAHSVVYLLKYIKKSGERLVYGGKLPTYFKSDIMDEDKACPYGVDDKKLLLFDSFRCIVDGEILGKVCPELIKLMPKCN